MPMSKKDYELIANAISSVDKRLNADPLGDAAIAIADVMAEDNPRFDRDKFLAACGIDQH